MTLNYLFSHRIGFAIAKSLAENGASVVVSSRKQKNVSEAVKKLQSEGHDKVTGIVCHVGSAEDRKKLFEEAVNKFGGVDILVSNAAVNPAVGPVLDVSIKHIFLWNFDITLLL